jgi:PAS domain S-box-containing protein
MISVLYIDDEPALLDSGAVFLERSGELLVTTVTNGREALQLMEARHFDAIVSDYQMPEMDGIELLKEVRRLYPELPFILFTGKGREEIVIQAIDNGADFYLQKGGDPKIQFVELEHKIRQAIRRRTAEEELRRKLDELTMNQKDLAESRRMLRAVIDTIPVRVFWKDTRLNYLGCNLPFAHDAGYRAPSEMIGRTDYDMGWAEQADLYRNDDRAVIESGNPKYNYEEPQTTPEGKTIWLRTSKIPLRNADGELLGILGTYEDITEQKRIQEVICGKNEELQAAYQQLSATDAALRGNYRLLLEREAALKENEEKYRNLFEAESDAVFLIDNETGAILEANNAAAALYGYSKEELLSRKNVDLSAEPEETQRVTSKSPINADQVLTIPLRYHKKRDGTVFPVEITGRFFRWHERPVHIAAIRDITERQKSAEAQQGRAERAVEYQKALVKLATTDAPTLRIALNRITEMSSSVLDVDRVSIWFFSEDGETLSCNDLFTGSTGIHEYGQEISRKDNPRFFTALHENRAIAAEDARNNALTLEFASDYFSSVGIVSVLDIPIRTGFTVVGMLCFEQTGVIRTWNIEEQDYGIAVADYTAIVLEQARRRLAEKDLRKSEEKYRAVINRANEGIVILQEGILHFVNPRAAELLGGSNEDLIGRSFFEFVAPLEREKVRTMEQRRKKGKDVPSVYETILISENSIVLDVELNASIMDYNGKPSDIVFIRDISDRKRSEQSLRLANQKLNLLSSVTRHDILNRLTVVIGYLELAKLTHDREKLEDFIRKIDSTLHVIEDQIMFTRDYQDMGVKDPEWQDASAAFDLVVSQLDLGKILMVNNLSGLSVHADPLLGKVIYNIVDNSLRYGQKCTEIKASYYRDESSVVLVIEDDGVGIPAKDKGRIFEKGFGQHTGLGLFLAKEILSLTGIEIMETGFPTKGARFELHIPAGRFRIGQ